jgi:hypothetical protein
MVVNTFNNFPSGTFDLLQIDFTAVGGPNSNVDFTFTLPNSNTIATFGGANVLTGTTGAVVNVTENPELVITPDVFNETVQANTTATNTFVVSTDNAGPIPGDLTVIGDASWLTIDPTNDGYVIDATGLTAGSYTANITASGTGYDDGFATVNLTVTPAGIPAALIEITPGQGLTASTYGGSDNFVITNQSTGGIKVTSVSIDLSTGLLPDMVFDPIGTGGDATAQCFIPTSNDVLTGLLAPTDPCVDPFSQPRQGGFDILTVNFNDFDPSESFGWITDIDPNSIQGVPGAGNAGAVSGYELVGATVTVSFDDGSTLVGSLFEEGSLGGANALVTVAPTATPSISVLGVSPVPATVFDPNQTIVVSGNPGDEVTLLQMDARLYIASGDPPFNVSNPTYYANEAMSGKAIYSGTIGAGGTVDIPVTLVQTPSGNASPDGGLNHFMAVTHTGAYSANGQTSQTSNPIVLKYDPFAGLEATIQVNPNANLAASTFTNNSFQIINTGLAPITSVSIDLSTAYLMDLVYDPNGTAGDAGAKCLTVNTLTGTPGFVAPADPCVDPFSQPHNGVDSDDGYDVISLDFTDFGPNEQFNFSVDLDPTSIKNDVTSGDAGAISGAELVGATVTVTYANGVVLTGCLWEDGSLGGSKVVVSPDAPPASPTISIQGFPTLPAITSVLNQTVDISGPANAEVVLLQWDTRLYIDAGSVNGPYDIDPFEANENMAKALYPGTLDGSGNLSVPVTLLETLSTNAGPDGGINHFMAVVIDPNTNLVSCISNVAILEVGGADVNGTIGNSLCAGTSINLLAYDPGTANLIFSGSGTVDGSGNFAVSGLPVGTFDLYVKADGFLQIVAANQSLSAGANAVNFGTLLAGDLDGNNQVDINDFTLFSPSFNSQTGDANYQQLADFNCDGFVDINDFTLFSPQFNTAGDQP